MKVTVGQLKTLIREAAAEALEEIGDDHDPSLEEDVMEEDTLHEAVTRAFRAGYQRGVKAATARYRRR